MHLFREFICATILDPRFKLKYLPDELIAEYKEMIIEEILQDQTIYNKLMHSTDVDKVDDVFDKYKNLSLRDNHSKKEKISKVSYKWIGFVIDRKITL